MPLLGQGEEKGREGSVWVGNTQTKRWEEG